jgi:outer membrane protein TolC
VIGALAKNIKRIPVIAFSISRIGIITVTLLFTGCIATPIGQYKDIVSPSADQAWTPVSTSLSQQTAAVNKVNIPEDLLKPGAIWQLGDVINIALQNNPDTRSAWYSARSAVDDWLSQKGNYYPQVNANANMSYATSSSAEFTSVVSFDPAVQLTWLIFDLGGRDAAVDEKYQALLVADFTHNATIQNAVFQVIQAYFQYANTKAVKKEY